MDKSGKWNTLVAALAGLTVFVGYSLFSVTAFTPEMSAHAAVVAGIRPAAEVFPGLWRYIALMLPPEATAFSLFGRILAGIFAAFAYFALRNSLSMLCRASKESKFWSNRIAPLVSFAGALMMTFADPVWRVFSIFDPASIFLLYVVVSVLLYQGWIVKGGWWRLCGGLFLIGLFLSETPLAIVIPVAFFYAFNRLWVDLRSGNYRPREDIPRISSLPIWRMFLSVSAGLFLGVGANLWYIVSNDLSGAFGWSVSYLVFHYWEVYLAQIPSAATVIGWLLAIGLVAIPFAIVVRLFPRVTDDDKPLSFHLGLIVLLCGIIAYFEQGPLRGAWFWTWLGDRDIISSKSLLGFVSMLASAAVAFAGATFFFDAFNANRVKARENGVAKCYHVAVFAILAVVMLLILPGLPHTNYRKVLAFNDCAIRETVRELNGATRLFTDGSADAALELEAKRIGQPLYTINLMGVDDNYNLKLRMRALTDDGDKLSAQMGAPVLLRVWATGKDNGLDDVALQLGLELWKRERLLNPPEATAFLARTKGLREDDVKNAGEIAKTFATRITELTPVAESADVPQSVRREFFSISWRLSRMARYRHDVELADKLEMMNTALKKMLREIEYERLRVFMQLTPSEGLEFALRRADFTEAARYGAAVLKIDKKNARANFGMGMYFLSANKLDEAEKYLRLVLEVRPNEPAALNNISIICRKSKRYDEAIKLAKKALDLLPDNEDVQKTYRDAINRAP